MTLYESLMGYCFRHMMNGHLGSYTGIIIQGTKTLSPMLYPEIILAYRMFGCICVTINLVPLQSPLAWLMFLINIITQPNFKVSSWLGILVNFNAFKSSIEYNDA